jgi:hypothetical protein
MPVLDHVHLALSLSTRHVVVPIGNGPLLSRMRGGQ